MPLTLNLPDALVALGRALDAAGYRFTTVTPATHQRVIARDPEAPAADLRDILGWSRPFAADTLAPQLLAMMTQAGVLAAVDKGWRATVRASTLDDGVYFHSAYPTSDEDAVFFGPDTYRFLAAIERALAMLPVAPRRVADIGCGAGPAAIGIARRYPDAEVLALDINDAALALTRVNAKVAGTGNVTACRSDLLDGVGGDFDLIVSNPPYLLDPAKRAYRHGGGRYGAGLSVAIVKAAMARLRPGGSLLLYTGVAMRGPDDAFLAEIGPLLDHACSAWRYEEIDPDVFGEEVAAPGYEDIERIRAVWLHAVKRHPPSEGAE
jgi:methylase of polypeptide subunit release factors